MCVFDRNEEGTRGSNNYIIYTIIVCVRVSARVCEMCVRTPSEQQRACSAQRTQHTSYLSYVRRNCAGARTFSVGCPRGARMRCVCLFDVRVCT